jgi:MoxR-like ATPase
VLEEIDQAGNDSLACLIVGLDEVALAMLTGPDGVVRRPDSRFHCVATMNAAPESLSQALLERFRYIIHIDRPKEAIFERLSPALREPARKTCMLTDPARRISLRDWLGVQHIWDLEVRLGASRKDALAIALWAVLGPRADDVLVALRLGDIV